MRELIAKAEESLRASRQLSEGGFHAFAASRAYYTMFYAAEALLMSHDLAFRSHAQVIGAIGREFVKSGLMDRSYHQSLITAQDLRHQGDYATAPGITNEDAKDIIAQSEEFLLFAKNYLDRA